VGLDGSASGRWRSSPTARARAQEVRQEFVAPSQFARQERGPRRAGGGRSSPTSARDCSPHPRGDTAVRPHRRSWWTSLKRSGCAEMTESWPPPPRAPPLGHHGRKWRPHRRRRGAVVCCVRGWISSNWNGSSARCRPRSGQAIVGRFKRRRPRRDSGLARHSPRLDRPPQARAQESGGLFDVKQWHRPARLAPRRLGAAQA